MIEIVPFDWDKFAREAELVEQLKALRNRRNKGIVRETEKMLLARLMVWAAYNKNELRIARYTNFLYRILFGETWYEDGVWMDEPINWLEVDLPRMAFDEEMKYDVLVGHAYSLINELCKDRNRIKRDRE
jgi:hypothetical protein